MDRYVVQIVIRRMPRSKRDHTVVVAEASTPYESEDGEPALRGAAARAPALFELLLHPPGPERHLRVVEDGPTT